MDKYTIYLGLNDKDTKKQEIGIIDAYKVATNIFCEITGGATIYESKGIYTHNDGTIVIENTFVCIVFCDDSGKIEKAAAALKTAFNQESVIVEKETKAESYFF